MKNEKEFQSEFTLYISTKCPLGKLKSPIFELKDELGQNIIKVLLTEDEKGDVLSLMLYTTHDDRPFILTVPTAVIGENDCHQLVIRTCDYKIEMFIDGVLMDEEWILGSIKNVCECFKSEEGLEVKIFSKLLSDSEIEALCGGSDKVNKKRCKYFGENTTLKQYSRPAGSNTNAGDCIPFYHNGTYHLFYLFDRHHHSSKKGLGAHQWMHISTTDLINFDEHDMAIPITDQWEGSICTGSVFYNEGTYYAFYAVRMYDYSAARLTMAVSKDCIHFEKTNKYFTLAAPYEPVSARDPVVFKDEKDGLFHMLVTTNYEKPQALGRTGCLAHLISSDLVNWEQKEPFIIPGYDDQPECADYFFWKGFYYLIFSNNGTARYRYSKNAFGPWIKPKVDMFDGPQIRVMKTAEFKDNRRIGVGFLNDGGYGGKLVFREILQEAEGSLWTSFPKEMLPQVKEKVDFEYEELSGSVELENNAVKIYSAEGIGITEVTNIPRDFKLSAEIKVKQDTAYYGLCFGGDGFNREGYELRFEPDRQKIGLRKVNESLIQGCDHTAIYNVDEINQTINVEVILKDDILDVAINNKRTMVNKIDICKTQRLFLYVQDGQAEFRNIQVNKI